MTTDQRYTIAKEYCGQAEPQYVVRFCGQWLGSAVTARDANRIAVKHAIQREKNYA